ncbi:GDP-mannose-dependent alpha-mannosyltransferase [Halomonadaceae bacterium LMG 33818]|uniref:glycosyltransferase family 4 protein n=1 Tax=Cernens ardua TaxID=3402176 RepID=UPI003EDBA505
MKSRVSAEVKAKQAGSFHEHAPAQRPMTVAFVSETWQPEVNGVTHTMSKLVDCLYQKGYTLQLVRPRPDDGSHASHMSGELQVKALPVFDYDGVHMGFIRPKRLRHYWENNRPDVIYIATEGPLGMVALRVARQLNIPVVSGFHTNFEHYSQYYILLRMVHPFVRTFLRRFHNKTNATLVPTQRQADSMTQSGYTTVKVMGRGLDTQHFSPSFRSDALRRSWGAEENSCVALYVGRLAVEKNVELLIRTLKALRSANPEQVAVIVGEGPLRAKLKEEVPWVKFAGFKHDQALSEYYASADLFLFPSLSETFGNVVTEAMASGLAVLAFDYAAASELIIKGKNGMTVPCDNEDAFVESAVKLASDISTVHAQGVNASQKVAGLNWENIGETFIDYLHQAQEENVNDAR